MCLNQVAEKTVLYIRLSEEVQTKQKVQYLSSHFCSHRFIRCNMRRSGRKQQKALQQRGKRGRER